MSLPGLDRTNTQGLTHNPPAGGGSGTVTSVSVATANGFSGSVANSTTTPAITIVAGAITPTSVAASGTVTGSNLTNALPIGGEQMVRVFRSPLIVSAAAALTVSNTAYFVFLGRMAQDTVIKFVEAAMTTNGVGAQTAEVGLFSTAGPPDKTAKTYTKLVVDSTVDSLTAGATKMVRNTTAFSAGAGYTVPAGTYLWAGIRTAMASTQPTLRFIGQDHQHGFVQTLAAAGALTAAGPFGPCTINAAVVGSSMAPDLAATMD